ncbi:hypothetical protein A3A79_01225 [Candidatus Gottesmanbacteria bacterium RIFCSPLOWO2_01_FULL_43_11b]|uniref:Beta-lactamase n=1 Tax=Candidatus Gottesmanbacteria bacterium RIFCSPLOWO2_01_FULL_43_11b TaxID=1798392 RepID=A0A1F6AGK1_9BACT|nr:MAG: hypothetical protein A3A79_01225 [Candidatus Gottesmanbacteria bacterium RIFCSPLOWO2_01_FULL_43_11b]
MLKLGKAFSDNLILEEKVKRRVVKEEEVSWWFGKGRALFFTTVFLVAFFILVWRLFELTLVQGHRYRLLADTNRTRDLIRHAARGVLLDRTGKALTVNIPRYILTKLCREGEVCTERISQEEGDQLSNEGLPKGWFLESEYIRQYPYGEALAHVLGYMGELSPKEFADDYYVLRNYLPGSFIGRMGAESAFEERLRGRDGRELVEIEANGDIVRSLGGEEASPGEDVTLSVDAGLAQIVAKEFPLGSKGAVVVSKPSTGEILVLFSSPSFVPEHVETVLNSPDEPLFNRAIGGVYPPGSTFKIVTAIAALEEGAIDKDTKVEDTGVIRIPPFTFPNWYFREYGKTEGMVDIVKAIQRSNDIFFYKTGEWLGITKLAAWARNIGIGKPLGIEISGEAAGLMPDPSWKNLQFNTEVDRELRNNEWYLGDTYHVAIGQGYLLTTPLQVNTWTNIVANGGIVCKPTIRKLKSECKGLNIQKETIDLITQGMKEACTSGGTGWPLFDFQISVACKTGTAEFGDPNNRTHAWFTTFAPAEDPEISVTVLVEGAGEGSNVAAPIAKKILEAWFGR